MDDYIYLRAGCQSGWWEDGCDGASKDQRHIGETEGEGSALLVDEWNADDESKGF
jgi:hypothetical protein